MRAEGQAGRGQMPQVATWGEGTGEGKTQAGERRGQRGRQEAPCGGGLQPQAHAGESAHDGPSELSLKIAPNTNVIQDGGRASQSLCVSRQAGTGSRGSRSRENQGVLSNVYITPPSFFPHFRQVGPRDHGPKHPQVGEEGCASH